MSQIIGIKKMTGKRFEISRIMLGHAFFINSDGHEGPLGNVDDIDIIGGEKECL